MTRFSVGALTARAAALGAAWLIGTGIAFAQAFDLNQLERQGRLEAAYEQAVAESSGLFVGAERRQQVEAMRERLAQREAARLEAELKKGRQVFGVAAIATSEGLRAQGEKLKRYDEARHAQWQQRLDTEVERARKVMETVRDRLDRTPESDPQARLDLMKSLALLGGAGSDEEKAYLQATDAAKAAAYERGSTARAEGRHEVAAVAFDFVLRLDARYKDAERLLLLSRLGIIESLWRRAADDTARAQALDLLKATVDGPEYAKYRGEAAPDAARLQAANLGQVERLLDEGRLIDAIGGVLRGRRIASLLAAGERAPVQTAEDLALQKRLREASDRATARRMAGLAYAFQRVADELVPKDAETTRRLTERRAAAIAALAPAVRLEVEAASSGRASLADALTRQVERAWPADLARAAQGAPADWVLRLSVLDAAVESDERKGRKVVRPPGSSEDLGVDLVLVRKKARLTVAMALAEADLAPAPVTETFAAQAEDQRHDGIQVGSFSLPVKLAELPADALLLEGLVAEAAGRGVGLLAATRVDPLRRFQQRAVRQAAAGQTAAAADSLALAALARELAGQPAKVDFDRAQRDALLAGPELLAPNP